MYSGPITSEGGITGNWPCTPCPALPSPLSFSPSLLSVSAKYHRELKQNLQGWEKVRLRTTVTLIPVPAARLAGYPFMTHTYSLQIELHTAVMRAFKSGGEAKHGLTLCQFIILVVTRNFTHLCFNTIASIILNNHYYLLKGRWISVNKNRDKVNVFIQYNYMNVIIHCHYLKKLNKLLISSTVTSTKQLVATLKKPLTCRW